MGPGGLASILGRQEAWGQKRCPQVEQETALLAVQTLVLGAEVSGTARSPRPVPGGAGGPDPQEAP